MSTALKKLDEPLAPSDPEKPRLWQRIVEIGAQIPDKEWRKVPADASAQVKHYLYGAAKKS